MSKVKVKEEATEVYVARSKLDGVLQTLVDLKEDGATPEKDLPNHQDSDSELFDSPLSSPAKKSPRVNRLQRKRKLIKEENLTEISSNFNQTYLMKLFDRTVDLAPFSEDAPLYPICRAWIRNQHYPGQPEKTSQQESDLPSGPFVCDLPEPMNVKTEREDEAYPMIPSPVKQDEEAFYINQDSNSAEPEDLFLNHMVRWKKVRQKWKKASRDNEMRYIESYKILKEMFDKQNRDM